MSTVGEAGMSRLKSMLNRFVLITQMNAIFDLQIGF